VRYLAYYDPLTAMPNRQRLLQILEQQVEWAVPRQRGLAVLMLDIDNFSRINDTQGQAVGDVLLKEVAHRLQNCLRDSQRTFDHADEKDITDWVARTGGDEFALALPGVCTAEAAQVVAQRVQVALARPFVFAQQEIPLSATMGISLFPGDAATSEALVKNADAAMHHGKKTGHGGLEFFNKAISTRAARHLSMEADLRKAVERGEFTLNYQPRLGLRDLRVEAVEALLRWRHPQRGFVAPDEFIPIAEQTGLIVEIGDWVLREACAQARRWRDAGGPGLASRSERVGRAVSRRQPGVARVARRRCRGDRFTLDRTGIHRRRFDRTLGRGEQGGQVAQGARGGHGAGRFRHRLQFIVLPAALSDRHAQDRSSLRARPSRRRPAAMRRWSTRLSPWRRA